jgi:hypothetical protein
MRFVDSLFSAIGKPRRVPGAAYTDEWWGDIPAAAPQAVFEGVKLRELHRLSSELAAAQPVSTPVPQEARPAPILTLAATSGPSPGASTPAPVAPAPVRLEQSAFEQELSEPDWEAVIAAARNRGDGGQPSSAPARAPEEEAEADWDRMILAAKCRVA